MTLPGAARRARNVIPAQAGIPGFHEQREARTACAAVSKRKPAIPAFAGMTK
jgi:hypothetical protein